MSAVLITIILGSNRPKNVVEFINDLETKTSKPEQVEILFSVDDGDTETASALDNIKKDSRFNIRYFSDARERGYFEANKQYNRLLLEASDSSIFFAVFSDKLKIKTEGWDDKLLKYHDIFEDGVVRVRITKFKHVRNYRDIKMAITCPDNFSFHSRKLLDLMGGWGDYWGPDSWTEAVMYMLETHSTPSEDLFRNITAHDISIEEYSYTSASRNDNGKKIEEIHRRNKLIGWAFNLMSHDPIALENFYRISRLINIYIYNYSKIKNLSSYEIIQDHKAKNIILKDNDKIFDTRDYYLPPKILFFLSLENFFMSRISAPGFSKKYQRFYMRYPFLAKGVIKFLKSLNKAIFYYKNNACQNIKIVGKNSKMQIEENQYIEDKIAEAYSKRFNSEVSGGK